MENLQVWLAYVAYPVTTAAYFERALRRCCRTTTIGPPLPQELIEKWQLQNMKLPLNKQDINTEFKVDMANILADTPPEDHPNLYIWIESVGGYYPINLHLLTCPKVCYLIDSHLNLPTHLEWAKQFDIVFIAQREYLDDFRRLGIRVHWLPLGCDTEIHSNANLPKSFPVGFVGSVLPGSRRESLLESISRQIPVHYERCFWSDMAQLFSQSKIVFNEAVKNDLNMRVFEVMSTGSMLMTDMAKNSGQDELFRDGEDYAVYDDSKICDVALFYLDNDQLRQQIACRGQKLVHNAHTYAHRIEDMINVVLKGKVDTFSATELRQRSLEGVLPIDSEVQKSSSISSAKRSFIIPVLDMSPASEFNIVTLLEDLKDIEGDVIVIFNGLEVAEHLKDHPRITRYAIMKQNIGVARAWNLGLEIAATPIAFILNADLHVKPSSIDALEQALLKLPGAACVGPQGSFVDYSLGRDYIYFDKGSFDEPQNVDNISGFFFAVKLRHFNEKIIRFENGFTPCYFEEWDLGLQLKQAGLKSYIVPTTDYDHHWSGSIAALREIAFYENKESADSILKRNRLLFLNKWRGVADNENTPLLLESGFCEYALNRVQTLIAKEQFKDATELLDRALLHFQNDSRLVGLKRFIDILAKKATESLPQTQEVIL